MDAERHPLGGMSKDVLFPSGQRVFRLVDCWQSLCQCVECLTCPYAHVYLLSTAELKDIMDDPTSLVSLLGESAPGTGAFFVNYVMLQGWS